MPGRYPGESCDRKTVLPIIPPIPPVPTRVAEHNALFHCPRMLFACHVSTAGTLALAAIVARKTPKYRTPTFEANPRSGRPKQSAKSLAKNRTYR